MTKFEGYPRSGIQCRVGWFSNWQRYVSETVRDRAQVTIITNRLLIELHIWAFDYNES